MKLKTLGLAIILSMVFIACSDDDPVIDPVVDTCETEGISYTTGISAILNASCAVAGCHVVGGGAFAMDDYTSAFVAVGFNRIVGSINHSDGFLPMPYPSGSDKISQCNIDKLTAWVNSGAPE